MTENQSLIVKKDVLVAAEARIQKMIAGGDLDLPANYSATNAMKSAWLILQDVRDKDGKPVLTACTRESIMNSLLDTVVQGLNPGKKQCYYIAYGRQLGCQRSYFGDEALVKRIHPGAEIYAEVIWQGDELEYEIHRGQKHIIKHAQKLENVGKLDKIAGAYAVVEIPGQPAQTTIMTIEQIKESWKKSKTYGRKDKESPHDTQPDQMALRTVIRRACKPIINSSSDHYLVRAAQRSDELAAEVEMEEEVAANANREVIDVEPERESLPEHEEEQTAKAGPGF